MTKITILPFTNGSKTMSFRGVTPLTPNSFRSPHLPKMNPAYAPGNAAQCFLEIKKMMKSCDLWLLYFLYNFETSLFKSSLGAYQQKLQQYSLSICPFQDPEMSVLSAIYKKTILFPISSRFWCWITFLSYELLTVW